MHRSLLPILVVIASLGVGARAQPGSSESHRAAGVRPDLSGVWTNASVTRLTRRPGVAKLVVGKAEAEAMAKADPLVRAAEDDAAPSDVNDDLLADGNAGSGYNAFWMDPGRTLALVKGEYRTSWIVDPPDGQLPLSANGRALVAEARKQHRTALAEGPEALAPWDRCLISSRGAGGPGMLNTIYNSNYQFVQSPGALVILVEQVHDARVIPIFPSETAAKAAHGRSPRWLGDSVGWWDGATLVAETVNVHPEQGAWGPVYLSPKARVTERFTRVSDRQILYEFSVDDPVYYSRPWRTEMSFNATPKPIYEFACHEGNYAMNGVLGGARADERRSGSKPPAAGN